MLKSQFQQIITTNTNLVPKPTPISHHLLHYRHYHHLFVSPSQGFIHSPVSLRRLQNRPSAVMEETNEGPVELFPNTNPVFSTGDDPSPIQVATSVLLTGAISVFLFRALRRRAKRAKEMQFRSSGVKKTIKEEAMESLKAMSTSTVETKGPPSPLQALLGAISAGVIALILYKFTTTIEASLNRQTMSDNFSVRQITITIRTVINGLCYLATFVFGINAVGLFLYSGQLAINSIMGEPPAKKTPTNSEETSKTTESPTKNNSDSSEENQSSDDTL